MTVRDYYQVLGVTRNASAADIRTAFVRLARYHHPDQATADGRMPRPLSDVQQAYRCLSDPDLRACHDAELRMLEHSHFARQRGVRHRLRRYDRRHPRRPLKVRRRIGWRFWLVIAVVAAIVVRVSIG